MALTTEETQILTTRLSEAETALHRLRIGGATVRIRHGLKDQTFSPASMSDLMSYIASLRSQLGLVAGPNGRQRATRVRFG